MREHFDLRRSADPLYATGRGVKKGLAWSVFLPFTLIGKALLALTDRAM